MRTVSHLRQVIHIRRSVHRPARIAVLPTPGSSTELTAVHRAHAVWVWARGRACLTGRSAAAVWGVDGISPDAPAAIATPAHLRAPAGVEVYRTTLRPDEQTDWLSIRLTTPARTAYELARRLTHKESLPLLEQLYLRTGLEPDDVVKIALRNPGSRGNWKVWQLHELSQTGVPTPFQSETRLEILSRSLPSPGTMISVTDESGQHRCHAHIGWEQQRVAVQCMETGRPEELENLNALVRHGWLVFVVDHRSRYEVWPGTLWQTPFPMLAVHLRQALWSRGMS